MGPEAESRALSPPPAPGRVLPSYIREHVTRHTGVSEHSASMRQAPQMALPLSRKGHRT